MPIRLELMFQPGSKPVKTETLKFEEEIVRIGKCPRRDIQLFDELVSSKHGKLTVVGSKVVYTDYSIAGTELYDSGGQKRKYILNSEIPINQRDVLKFGMYRLTLVE